MPMMLHSVVVEHAAPMHLCKGAQTDYLWVIQDLPGRCLASCEVPRSDTCTIIVIVISTPADEGGVVSQHQSVQLHVQMHTPNCRDNPQTSLLHSSLGPVPYKPLPAWVAKMSPAMCRWIEWQLCAAR